MITLVSVSVLTLAGAEKRSIAFRIGIGIGESHYDTHFIMIEAQESIVGGTLQLELYISKAF